MEWFFEMFIIFIAGLAIITSAIVLGLYWLKHERFPWEKKAEENSYKNTE